MNKLERIVGIGASAGGLRAITEFFDHIPDHTGMAFVVIQHLSPDFKSMMNELLKKHTGMPIHIIDKPTLIEADTIYLISSKQNVVLEQSMLKPTKRSDALSINLPIDLFFHSLGNKTKKNMVGIILSGTGSDGSKGIQTIKKAGGIVMVEDPHHAQFDGMPMAALASGKIDFVLPPYALARELMRLNEGKERKTTFLIIDPEKDDFPPLFEEIITEIYSKTGINFKNYKYSTLIRRMEKRMFITKQHDLEAYLKYLKKDQEEVNILQEEFLINVTHFFRDKKAFDELKELVIPGILANKEPRDQIRIWIAACSTGQEAISVAILFKEYLEANGLSNPLKIFASDIDKSAINVASEAVYDTSLLGVIPQSLLNKYFEPLNPEKTRFSVVKSLRETIVYAVHDAMYDPPFINLDLITCRNMMIYLNNKNQKILLSNFHFALNYKGYLFLGPSESIGDLKSSFKTMSSKWNLYQNMSAEKQIQPAISKESGARLEHQTFRRRNTRTPFKSAPEKTVVNDKYYTKVLIEQFAPTCILVNENLDILLTNGNVGKILSFPRVSGYFNLNEMVGAEELIVFKNGIQKCKANKRINLYENISYHKDGDVTVLNMQFTGVPDEHDNKKQIYIIEFFFNDRNVVSNTEEDVLIVPEEVLRAEKVKVIQRELRQIRQEKQVLVQELEMANEELQASNEELLAANEELQSTNEELQSVNEELYTVNTELQNKVNQLITTTNDLDNLLNSTEIGSIFLDQELNIRRFTPAIIKQFALLDSDIGRPITGFANSFVDKNMYPEIENVVNKLVVFEKEIKDDKGNHYLMRVLPYRTDAGQVDGAVLTFIPINELKKANDQFTEIAERYRAVFDNSYDGIMLMDKKGKIISSNHDFAGFPKEKIKNRSILKMMPYPYGEILKTAMDQVIKGDPSSFFHFESEDKKGKKQWFSATVTPIIIEEEITGLAFITRDVTELKEKEMELRQMGISLEKQVADRSNELAIRNNELKEINSYLDSFVHGAAHDLRAPITQIKGMLNLFPKIKEVDKKEVVFQEISSCVKRLEKTLTGLIEMIDFQKNNNRLSHNINLAKSFREVTEQLDYDIKSTKAELKVDIPEDLTVNFIQAYITSIFYNLMSNALKYRDYDKPLKIKVLVKQAEEFVVIKVSDNGIGIDLNRYGHFLFQPFKRLTVEREGTGIGLSIINNVVRKNGGRIEVESNLKKGTQFTVFIKPLNIHEHAVE